MALGLLKNLRNAYSKLNPDQVRQMAEKPLSIELVADSEEAYSYMEAYLLPAKTMPKDRVTGLQVLRRAVDRSRPSGADISIYEQGIACPRGAFTFYVDQPEQTVAEILRARPELEVSLARQFVAFRQPAIRCIISRIAKENALFTLATAMPNIVPTFFELPWALGEYATDSAFLTINQVRMAFLIAAASGRKVGLAEQKAEIATIVGSAFGWRALARELVGKIPLGGGLIPKAAISWAGTFVLGRTMEQAYVTGERIKRNEHKELYAYALRRGKQVAGNLLQTIRKTSAA